MSDTLKVFHQHFLLHFRSLMRQPAYVISSLFFPSLFFIFFAQPNAKTAEEANFLMASFAAFAVLSVVFLDFSVATSQERVRAWSRYTQTLAAPVLPRLLSRVTAVMIFAVLAAVLVCLTVHLSTAAVLSTKSHLLLFGLLVVAALPLALIAYALGLWVAPRSALPVTNLFYLTLSFAGGLWLPPNALPELVKEFSPYLPTRLYGEILWSHVQEASFNTNWVWGLLAYALVAIAAMGWRLRVH